MLRLLIDKEIREMVGSPKFVVTFGVCAFLIVVSFYVGGLRHKLNLTQYQASRAEQVRALEGVTDWMDVDEVRVFLPPQPLAALVSGVSNDIGRTASIGGRGDVPIEDSRYNEDPIYAMFRFMDLEFIFTVVLSMFAILLGYDAISGEKERGTLRLSFANALPRSTFILGKILGSYITLTLSILVAVMIGVLALIAVGIHMTSAEWIRLALIIAAGLLFFGAFLSLSIMVSALTSRSSSSFLILLVVWVMAVQIVPRVSVLLAARSVRVPSVDEIAYKKSVLAKQLSEEFYESLENLTIPAKAEGGKDPMTLFNTYMDSLSTIRTTKLQTFSDRLREERANLQLTQEKLAFSLARISPVSQLSLAITSLAGTSLHLKDRFYGEANDYKQEFSNFLKDKTGISPNSMVRVKAKVRVGDDGESATQNPPSEIDISELPRFEFANVGLRRAIADSTIDFGLLFLLNLVFFAASFVAFVRYDVR